MSLRRLLIFLLIIILLGLVAYYYPYFTGMASSLSNNENSKYEKESVYVDRVIDGDTIVVSGQSTGNQTHIRLLGINTPEHDQPYYAEAKDFLIREIEGKKIEILRDITDEDKYNRKLRYVFYGDRFFDVEILQQGFATSFMLEGLKYKDKLVGAEKFARDSGIKLWKKSSDKCADCIKLLELNYKEEFFVIKNSCEFNCELDKWFVKDDANHFFYLKKMAGLAEEKYNSKTDVWNNNGDRFFMRDNKGELVVFYEY